VEYPIAREYKDSSKDILNELGVKIDDEDDECDDCEGDSDCGVDNENVILVE